MKKATRKMLPRKKKSQSAVEMKTEKETDTEDEEPPILVTKVIKQYTRKKVAQPSVNKPLVGNGNSTEALAATSSETTKVKEEVNIKEEMESGSDEDEDDKLITMKEEVEMAIDIKNEVVGSNIKPTHDVDGLTEGGPSITKKCDRRKDDTDLIKLKKCYLVAVSVPEPPKRAYRRSCCRRQVALLEAKKVGTPENLPPFKVVANSEIFTCELCDKTFLSLYEVRVHVRAAHRVAKDYRCELCPASYPHNYLLLGHYRKHTGKPLDCDLCSKRFKKLMTYSSHLNTHLRERLFSCPVCLSRFTDIDSLQRHALRHSPEDVFDCETCDEQSRSRIDLRRHIEKVHGKNTANPCYVCTRVLESERDLYVHLDSHANAVYECAFCRKRFTDVGRWEDHSAGHIDKMKKQKSSVTHVYGCDICHKRFKYASIFKTHMNSHTDERPYTCAICSKKYKTRSALTEHENDHKRPFVCHVCAARFGKRCTLIRHCRTQGHICPPRGERPVPVAV